MQANEKYARVSDKKRDQLVRMTVHSGLTIAKAAKVLGIKYDNAKFIMRTYRLEKRTRKISHSERFQNRKRKVNYQATSLQLENSDNSSVDSSPISHGQNRSEIFDSKDNDYEPDFKGDDGATHEIIQKKYNQHHHENCDDKATCSMKNKTRAQISYGKLSMIKSNLKRNFVQMNNFKQGKNACREIPGKYVFKQLPKIEDPKSSG